MSAPPTTAGHKQFPCKQCGAKLEFAPGTNVLKCPYCSCENEIPAEQVEHVHETDFLAALAEQASGAPTHETISFKCAGCGAQSTLPPDVTSGACSFCGTPFVGTGQSHKTIRPEGMLPFAITKENARQAYTTWLGSLWWAPGNLARFADSDHGLTGMYLPYWTYNCNAATTYTGERGDDYTETETYTEMESYTEEENGQTVTRTRPVTKTREVIKTRWSYVSGAVDDNFENLLVLASQSLPAGFTQKLEPWDLEDLQPYQDDYLSGFQSESYQIDLAQGFGVAKEMAEPTIQATIRQDIGGDHQRISSARSVYSNITFKHILLPIWISAYRYQEKVYRFLVNGRTGHVQGERPYSAFKIIGAVIAGLVLLVLIILLFAAMHHHRGY